MDGLNYLLRTVRQTAHSPVLWILLGTGEHVGIVGPNHNGLWSKGHRLSALCSTCLELGGALLEVSLVSCLWSFRSMLITGRVWLVLRTLGSCLQWCRKFSISTISTSARAPHLNVCLFWASRDLSWIFCEPIASFVHRGWRVHGSLSGTLDPRRRPTFPGLRSLALRDLGLATAA